VFGHNLRVIMSNSSSFSVNGEAIKNFVSIDTFETSFVVSVRKSTGDFAERGKSVRDLFETHRVVLFVEGFLSFIKSLIF